MVSKKAQTELTYFLRILDSYHFQPKTPVLDLTASGPGVLFLANAKPVGWPWILGLLPESTEVAQKILDNSNHSDLRNAWIIVPENDDGYLNAHHLLDSRDIQIDNKNNYLRILPNSSFKALFGRKVFIYKPVFDSLNDN